MIKGVKQFISGTSDISVAEGIKFNYPKGFIRLNEKGKIAFHLSIMYALILNLLQFRYKKLAQACLR